MQDLRLAIRSLRATSMATAFAILLLSLGVATTVVLFAVADAAIFRPFPFLMAEGHHLEEDVFPHGHLDYRQEPLLITGDAINSKATQNSGQLNVVGSTCRTASRPSG